MRLRAYRDVIVREDADMSTRQESDEWLMGQVRLGNRDALEKLVRRYASPLLTFIERMVGDRHRAEELFQEVFLSVWTKRRRYKLTKPFRSWLYTIAANRCRAEFRRKSPPTLTEFTAETVPGRENSPTETAIASETAAIVSAAVAQLPAQQCAAVVLRTWNGMSYAEIAEVTGAAEGTVRSNMHRGLANMREYLEVRLS